MATRNTNIVVPNLVKPNVSGSINQWGYILNEDLDKITEFSKKVISDSEMQNQELARLENEKLNIEDIPSKVEPVVQEFLETTIKPEIDDYIDTVSKPDITKHVETKKQEINTYVNTTSKPALDTYEKEKEKELNTYTTTKKGELDSHTTAKRGELDAYEKTKETQLNNYTGTKQTQLDSYTTTKKGELDSHTTAKEGQLDTYTTGKEGELDTHTAEKKSELDVYEKTKEGELNTFTGTKKTEITNHTNTKKGELDTYTTQKKGEITTHTDSEIERINADSELAKKQNITDSRLQTESKEIVGAINESLWKIVAKQINNNDDLNNYKTSGMFMSKSSNFNILNKPKDFRGDGALFLSVFALAPSIVKQVIYNYVNNQTFERRWNTDNWSEWAEILNNDSKLFLGTSGISSVTYIQDSGTKTQGQGYIDKSTGQVYLCLETNTDTTITNKFMSITNVELGKKIKQNTDDKVNKTDIVDNLTTADKSKVLSANMGKYIEQIGIFGGKKEITASNDLDTLTQSGIYWCNNVTKEQFNYEGVDFYGFGTLIVSNVNKTSDTFMQMFISHNWEQDEARNRRGCVLIRFVLDGRANNWYPILTSNSSEFLGGLGINYSKVFYIQDAGEKTAGNGYVDKTTGQLYLCKTTNSDVTVTDKFVLATNIENAKGTNVVKYRYLLDSSYNLNNITSTGYYQWYIEVGFPSNMPTGVSKRGLLMVITVTSHTFQQIADEKGNIFSRFKISSGWSSWVKYTTTVVQ